jgi:hypothetical protein
MLHYLAPYPILDQWLATHALPDTSDLDLPYASYIAMIRRLIEPVAVDEAWYRAAYPGIADAIDRGVLRSAFHHFLAHGYFENRLPFAADRDDRTLPVPFADIKAATPIRPTREGLRVRLKRADLIGIVKRLLHAVPVDELWYRQTYPGVAAAIAKGSFPSAAAHFVRHGYEECRWPFPMRVDETWYLARYPDARQAVATGAASSAQDHFWRSGYREGRFPTPAPAL